MKLYTEEQILNSMKSVKYYIEHYNENVIDSIIDKHLKALQPIELPSDEVIDERFDTSSNRLDSQMYESGFRDGAKWLKEQILNQDK